MSRRNNKQSKGLSIRFKVFLYLIGFAVILLGILWYFQVVHLNDFYEKAKEREFKEAINIVNSQYESGTLEGSISQIAQDYDLHIHVIDADGSSALASNAMESDFSYGMRYVFFDNLRTNTIAQGGEMNYKLTGRLNEGENLPGNLFEIYKDKEGKLDFSFFYLGDGFLGNEDPSGKPNQADHGNASNPSGYNPRESVSESQSMVYTHLVTNSAGEEQLILLSMVITPVDATVYTLRKQFVYIAILFVVAAMAIGFGISFIVSRPIQRINASAKQLAEGDFEIKFAGTGYKEVQELSDTLNYAAEELGRTEKLRQELIANVSHDLRTPLTMITAYSEVMRDLPGENTPENAQIIIDETKRLTTLVNDMLDLSKLQAGVMVLEKSTFNFTKNILFVMNRFSKLKEQDGFDIRFEYEDEVMITADEYKIYQVVYNLIINAINYAGEDKQVVVRQLVQEDVVRIEVEDHGCGIEPDEVKNIWDRYYKIDKTHKRAVQGTGLGLSIVQNILKMHEAEFGVDSTVGEGTTFWFELQIADAPLQPDEESEFV